MYSGTLPKCVQPLCAMELDGKWIVSLNGSPEDIEALSAEFSGEELRLVRAGGTFYMEGSLVPQPTGDPSTAWEAYRLIRLLNAIANLRLGSFHRIRLRNGAEARLDWAPSLAELFRQATDRELYGSAICSFDAGGPEGLFESYDALSYEIVRSGLAASAGGQSIKDWIVDRGWAAADEMTRFLQRVNSFRGEPNPAAISPIEAAELMRRLLLKFTAYWRNSGWVPPPQ
jgi:hypothetical protein